jgi:hypothetical protein
MDWNGRIGCSNRLVRDRQVTNIDATREPP